jgi:hypothetical protein
MQLGRRRKRSRHEKGAHFRSWVAQESIVTIKETLFFLPNYPDALPKSAMSSVGFCPDHGRMDNRDNLASHVSDVDAGHGPIW